MIKRLFHPTLLANIPYTEYQTHSTLRPNTVRSIVVFSRRLTERSRFPVGHLCDLNRFEHFSLLYPPVGTVGTKTSGFSICGL